VLIWAIGCVAGSVIYRLAIALALNSDALGLQASDLNLVTAILVTVALILPGLRNSLSSLFSAAVTKRASP